VPAADADCARRSSAGTPLRRGVPQRAVRLLGSTTPTRPTGPHPMTLDLAAAWPCRRPHRRLPPPGPGRTRHGRTSSALALQSPQLAGRRGLCRRCLRRRGPWARRNIGSRAATHQVCVTPAQCVARRRALSPRHSGTGQRDGSTLPFGPLLTVRIEGPDEFPWRVAESTRGAYVRGWSSQALHPAPRDSSSRATGCRARRCRTGTCSAVTAVSHLTMLSALPSRNSARCSASGSVVEQK